MDQRQYRIVAQDTIGPTLDYVRAIEQWQKALDICEARGLNARLEQRDILDGDLRAALAYPAGYIYLAAKDITVCPWELAAGAHYGA